MRTTSNRLVGVYEYGDPEGAPVFAMHGAPACGAGFEWTDEPARERGLRVLAPDRPGIGHSDPVRLASVADYATEFGALADALGIGDFSVLGYSGGGPYALAVAHLLGQRVRACAIAAGSGEIGTWATTAELVRSDRQLTWLALHTPAVARVALRIADRTAIVAPRFVLRSVGSEMTSSDREVLRGAESPREALALFTQALTHSAAGVVDDYVLLARPWGIPLEEIAVPVHCWHGTADTLVPLAHTEALIERLPDARLTTWPGEGHLGVITHVGEVLDAIVADSRDRED